MIKILMSSAAIAPLLFFAPAALAQNPNHSGNQMSQSSSTDQQGSQNEKRGPSVSGESQQNRDSHANSGSATQNEPQSNDTNRKESAGDHEHKSQSKTGRSTETTQSGANQSDTKQESQTGTKHNLQSPNEQRSGAAETHGRHEGKSHRGTTTENSANAPRAGEKTNATNESTNNPSRNSTNARGHQANQLGQAKQKRLRDSLSKEHVKNITHADFSMNVGVVVPSHYHFYPLPDDVVSFLPEYRGYDYIVVNNEIVIVEPETHKIVYTLPQNQTAEYNHRSVDCR